MDVPPSSPLRRRPLLVGMVHLEPLPGAPKRMPHDPREAWLAPALRDAKALAEAGFDAVMVENHGDAPFFKGPVPSETVAALAVAASRIRDALPEQVAVGVNVLRNDALAAVGVAAAAGLQLVRVNVLAGAYATDQGVVEGEAAALMRARARLAPGVAIFADVRVKHALPIAPRPLADEARDLVARAGADALLVTGPGTGREAKMEDLETVRAALPDVLLLAASGVTAANVREILEVADGAIVGTSIKEGGWTDARVDAKRARALVEAARGQM